MNKKIKIALITILTLMIAVFTYFFAPTELIAHALETTSQEIATEDTVSGVTATGNGPETDTLIQKHNIYTGGGYNSGISTYLNDSMNKFKTTWSWFGSLDRNSSIFCQARSKKLPSVNNVVLETFHDIPGISDYGFNQLNVGAELTDHVQWPGNPITKTFSFKYDASTCDGTLSTIKTDDINGEEVTYEFLNEQDLSLDSIYRQSTYVRTKYNATHKEFDPAEAYIAAYYEEGSYYYKRYQTEQAQNALWLYKNGGAANSEKGRLLYETAVTVKEFNEPIKPTLSPGTDIGTIIEGSNYKVGPIHMNDYSYAWCESAEIFSGSFICGIKEAVVTFDNGKKMTLNAGHFSFTPNSSATSRAGNYWKAPTEENGYFYPTPDTDFYLLIPYADGNVIGATQITDLTFTYKWTTAEGSGWDLNGTATQLNWEGNLNSYNDERLDGDETYTCSKCKHDGIEFSKRSAGFTAIDVWDHVYWCLEEKFCEHGKDGFHCSTGNCDGTEGSKKLHCTTGEHTHSADCLELDCEYENVVGHVHNNTCYDYCDDDEHTHGDSCYCQNCTHDYCKHGHQNGKHDGTCHDWGEGDHEHDCNGPTYCSGGHGHSTCVKFFWKVVSQETIVTQKLLGVEKAEVHEKTTTCSINGIPLVTKVEVNKYIYDVNHTLSYDGFDSSPIHKSDERSSLSEGDKQNNPVYVEYGDRVTFKVVVVNHSAFGVKVRLEDILQDYSKMRFIEISIGGQILNNINELKDKIIAISPGGTSSFYVTVMADAINGTYHNYARLITRNFPTDPGYVDYVRTIDDNGPIVNHSTVTCNGTTNEPKIESRDWYIINNYNASIDKYISKYNEAKMIENNNYAFTSEEQEKDANGNLPDRYSMNEAEKQNKPLQVEKNERIEYSIRITNDATELGNSVSSGRKTPTTVRPNKITETLDLGLVLDKKNVTATVYTASGQNKYGKTIPLNIKEAGNNTYIFELQSNNIDGRMIMLDPGEYIIYQVPVDIIKSNMYLFSLENTGTITLLTNVNDVRGGEQREVQNDNGVNENISNQQVSRDWVKLKDLVIAGKVWLDRDKDGYMGKDASGQLEVGGEAIDVETNPSTHIEDTTGKEYAMKGIIVKLYKSDGTLIRTTKTDENGLFTFARKEDGIEYYDGVFSYSGANAIESQQRIPKATEKDPNCNYSDRSQLISYYIEYEYDGLVYKSTEIYSDNTNLDNEGGIKADNKYLYDSNAYEFKDVREEFNKNYEIVSLNKASKGDLSDSQVLEYEKQNHNSYIRENNSRVITARSFITKDSNSSINNTKCLWLYKQTNKDDKPETEYLKYINLGLEEREDVDISITQDVYEVKTTINGEDMTYEYNQNNYTLDNVANALSTDENVNLGIDKMQEHTSGNESEYSKSFNSERFMTGYKNDTSSVEENTNLYNFEYYLEDYNYRISQYHTDTVRAYKGSPDRNFNANAVNDANSILLANSVGRESELNTEVTFRIQVTNNAITNDEPFKANEERDVKVYTGINEIVEYYDKDFVNLTFNTDGTIQGFNIKTKDANGYLVNKELKVLSAVAIMSDGSTREVTLSKDSKYNDNRTLENYDTLYITPTVENTHSNTLTGQGIKAGDFILAEGENLDILITFIVEKEIENPDIKEIETILGAKENIAEISAYSTYYQDGNNYKSASLIDKDSNPGNHGEIFDGVSNIDSKEYIKYFEDDTFKTGINFKTPDPEPEEEERSKENVQRTLTGFVWDDARTNIATDKDGQNKDGTQYIGDGTYDPDIDAIPEAKKNQAVENKEEYDIDIQDVKATLVEVIRMPDPDNPSIERTYEDTIYVNGEEGSAMSKRTDSDGKYMLSGYVPGEYIVRFDYGDDVTLSNMLIFNGQDYKSTSYQTGESVYAENAVGIGDKAATDVALDILEKSGNSDAKDDEIRRLEVIGYSETMTNERNQILRGKDSTDPTALINHTSMKAETADFLVRAEKEIKKVTVLTFYEHNKKVTETITEARFRIHNIDFGLQYRPELQVALSKYLSNITVTTSDDGGATETPLIDAIFNPIYGVVRKTDTITGATSFVTGANGEIVTVDPAAPITVIENAITTAGGNISEAQKNNNDTYVIALAGTILDSEKSIGLNNVQYLPNEYDIDEYGMPEVEIVDGKYLVKATQGFAYLVIDDNIMQGATIKVKYLLNGQNFSEIDRVSSNLSDIRFKENRETEKYAKLGGTASQYYEEYAYQVSGDNEKPTFINQDYSAALTARNALFSEYYRYELENNQIKKDLTGQNDIKYTVKTKDMPVNGTVIQVADVQRPHEGEAGYYGRYLGSTYYTGTINKDMEVVAELKLDKILDYIDNDLVFSDSENKDENNLWKTTTSEELLAEKWIAQDVFAGLDTTGAIITRTGTPVTYKLVDSEGRRYDTNERSNLALSLDDRVRDDYAAGETDPTVNKNISKFLKPRYSESLESFGTITITSSKVLSPEDKSDDMTYENVAEIIQYTSVTGRVTNLATTIGNAKIEEISSDIESPEFNEGRTESDTASVERITLTPPTGLSRVNQVVRDVVESASYTVIVIIVVVLVCVVVAVSINLYHKRRIK